MLFNIASVCFYIKKIAYFVKKQQSTSGSLPSITVVQILTSIHISFDPQTSTYYFEPASAKSDNEFNAPSPSENTNSNPHFYKTWEISPFAKYLKIDPNVVISRKKTKTNPQHPPAVSSKDYFRIQVYKQNKKKIGEEKKKRAQRTSLEE